MARSNPVNEAIFRCWTPSARWCTATEYKSTGDAAEDGESEFEDGEDDDGNLSGNLCVPVPLCQRWAPKGWWGKE